MNVRVLSFGIVVTLIFQASPVELIVIAQALAVFVAPVLAALIVMANRSSLMGDMKNGWWQNIALGILGLAAVFALSIRLFVTLFLAS